MAGLLGSMLAGAAGGYAKARISSIDKQEDFDLKMALADAQYDMNVRLEESGYQRDKARAAEEQDEVKAITDSVKDPMADKGGFEDEGAKVKREYDMVQQKVTKLRDAGKYDAADRLQKDLDRIDTKNNKDAALELRTLIAENNFKNQTGLLSLREQALEQTGKIADAKNETQLAKLEASNSRAASGGGGKTNEAQARRADFIEAYANNPKYVKNGKLTGEGYDKLNKLSDDANMQTVTEKPLIDDFGAPVLDEDKKPVIQRSVTRKEKTPQATPKPKAAPKPWERKY